MDVAGILEVEAASEVFANAMTDAVLRADPQMRRDPVFDSIRREVAMAATDIGQMMLGVPNPDDFYERTV